LTDAFLNAYCPMLAADDMFKVSKSIPSNAFCFIVETEPILTCFKFGYTLNAPLSKLYKFGRSMFTIDLAYSDLLSNELAP